MIGAIREYVGADFSCAEPNDALRLAREFGIEISDGASLDAVVVRVFEERVEARLIQPTFITDYPAFSSPLARRSRENPRFAERFELFINGGEFANGYSELNDPVEHRQNFDSQAERRLAGNPDVPLPDYSFIEALEYGMPPCGGVGIGIDRVVMLLTGAHHIQDVILFPLR